MHVELSNFEIRCNSSSKIWRNFRRNNTGYGCTYQTRTSPLVRVKLFKKNRRLDVFCHS